MLKGGSEGMLELPTGITLLDDPEFWRYVEDYAKVWDGVGEIFSWDPGVATENEALTTAACRIVVDIVNCALGDMSYR